MNFAALNRSFVEPFFAGIFCLSALESRSYLPLCGRVRRPSVLTTQRGRHYSRPQRFLLHHSRSRAPPSKGLSTVRLSSLALLSFHFPRFHWHFHFSAWFFFLRLLSPVLIFPELPATFLSHWATYGATATNTSSSFTDHPSPAVCPYLLYRSRARFHRWFPTLSRNWSPGYVTKTKSAALNRSFLLSRSSPGHFSVLLRRVAFSRPYAGVSTD